MSDPSAFDAVVDTNVLLDVYSWHDLLDRYEELARESADGKTFDIDHPRAVSRRVRARESILLVLYFHERRLRTYSLQDELIDILTRRAPPHDLTDASAAFATEIVHVVKERAWSGWDANVAKFDDSPIGNEADRRLVERARELGAPLITNEGYDGTTVRHEKLRERAVHAGVRVAAPHEFYEGRLDEAAACEAFLERLRVAGRERVASGPAHLPDLYAYMFGYYRHVFYGETIDPTIRALVRSRSP